AIIAGLNTAAASEEGLKGKQLLTVGALSAGASLVAGAGEGSTPVLEETKDIVSGILEAIKGALVAEVVARIIVNNFDKASGQAVAALAAQIVVGLATKAMGAGQGGERQGLDRNGKSVTIKILNKVDLFNIGFKDNFNSAILRVSGEKAGQKVSIGTSAGANRAEAAISEVNEKTRLNQVYLGNLLGSMSSLTGLATAVVTFNGKSLASTGSALWGEIKGTGAFFGSLFGLGATSGSLTSSKLSLTPTAADRAADERKSFYSLTNNTKDVDITGKQIRTDEKESQFIRGFQEKAREADHLKQAAAEKIILQEGLKLVSQKELTDFLGGEDVLKAGLAFLSQQGKQVDYVIGIKDKNDQIIGLAINEKEGIVGTFTKDATGSVTVTAYSFDYDKNTGHVTRAHGQIKRDFENVSFQQLAGAKEVQSFLNQVQTDESKKGSAAWQAIEDMKGRTEQVREEFVMENGQKVVLSRTYLGKDGVVAWEGAQRNDDGKVTGYVLHVIDKDGTGGRIFTRTNKSGEKYGDVSGKFKIDTLNVREAVAQLMKNPATQSLGKAMQALLQNGALAGKLLVYSETDLANNLTKGVVFDEKTGNARMTVNFVKDNDGRDTMQVTVFNDADKQALANAQGLPQGTQVRTFSSLNDKQKSSLYHTLPQIGKNVEAEKSRTVIALQNRFRQELAKGAAIERGFTLEESGDSKRMLLKAPQGIPGLGQEKTLHLQDVRTDGESTVFLGDVLGDNLKPTGERYMSTDASGPMGNAIRQLGKYNGDLPEGSDIILQKKGDSWEGVVYTMDKDQAVIQGDPISINDTEIQDLLTKQTQVIGSGGANPILNGTMGMMRNFAPGPLKKLVPSSESAPDQTPAAPVPSIQENIPAGGIFKAIPGLPGLGGGFRSALPQDEKTQVMAKIWNYLQNPGEAVKDVGHAVQVAWAGISDAPIQYLNFDGEPTAALTPSAPKLSETMSPPVFEGLGIRIELDGTGALKTPVETTVMLDGAERKFLVTGITPDKETGGWRLVGQVKLEGEETLRVKMPDAALEGTDPTPADQVTPLPTAATTAHVRQEGNEWVFSQGTVGLEIHTQPVMDADTGKAEQRMASFSPLFGKGTKLEVDGKVNFAAFGITVHRGEVQVTDQGVLLGDGTVYENKNGLFLNQTTVGGLPAQLALEEKGPGQYVAKIDRMAAADKQTLTLQGGLSIPVIMDGNRARLDQSGTYQAAVTLTNAGKTTEASGTLTLRFQDNTLVATGDLNGTFDYKLTGEGKGTGTAAKLSDGIQNSFTVESYNASTGRAVLNGQVHMESSVLTPFAGKSDFALARGVELPMGSVTWSQSKTSTGRFTLSEKDGLTVPAGAYSRDKQDNIAVYGAVKDEKGRDFTTPVLLIKAGTDGISALDKGGVSLSWKLDNKTGELSSTTLGRDTYVVDLNAKEMKAFIGQGKTQGEVYQDQKGNYLSPGEVGFTQEEAAGNQSLTRVSDGAEFKARTDGPLRFVHADKGIMGVLNPDVVGIRDEGAMSLDATAKMSGAAVGRFAVALGGVGGHGVMSAAKWVSSKLGVGEKFLNSVDEGFVRNTGRAGDALEGTLLKAKHEFGEISGLSTNREKAAWNERVALFVLTNFVEGPAVFFGQLTGLTKSTDELTASLSKTRDYYSKTYGDTAAAFLAPFVLQLENFEEGAKGVYHLVADLPEAWRKDPVTGALQTAMVLFAVWEMGSAVFKAYRMNSVSKTAINVELVRDAIKAEYGKESGASVARHVVDQIKGRTYSEVSKNGRSLGLSERQINVVRQVLEQETFKPGALTRTAQGRYLSESQKVFQANGGDLSLGTMRQLKALGERSGLSVRQMEQALGMEKGFFKKMEAHFQNQLKTPKVEAIYSPETNGAGFSVNLTLDVPGRMRETITLRSLDSGAGPKIAIEGQLINQIKFLENGMKTLKTTEVFFDDVHGIVQKHIKSMGDALKSSERPAGSIK
ncbi:MAG: hypothetical protein HY548_06730, partial [Elusimicrobia bacterium]|nr:hypothetical protein [Elusimicrobiota bacterium]